MRNLAMILAGLLILGARAAWAQPAPSPSGAAGGPAEMGPGPDRAGDDGGPRWHEGPGGPRDSAVTEAQEKELRAFVKTNDPQMDENLTNDKARRPMWYGHQLAGLWRMYTLPAGRERWIKQAKARRDITEWLAQFKSADDAQKAAIKEKLEKAVGDLFDADLEERGNQALAMETEAGQLKEKIAKRRQDKDKIVAQRVERITGEGDDWSW